MFIFVSDLFVEDYVGGAELTTDAIIKEVKVPVLSLRSNQVTKQIIDAHKDRHWIFGNFSGLSTEVILHCCKNLKYSVIEYDYKYCKFRLPEKHIAAEGSCDCETSSRGKMISVFYAKAENLWFMSMEQMMFYYGKFPFLDKPSNHVLSSVFHDTTLNFIESLNCKDKNDTWLIQKSNSWVKGTEEAVKYAQDNNLDYELFSDIEYGEMLRKFSEYKGFIFLPRSFDTCPRTVIEAKLLGCKLILNENVQHKDEEWFAGDRETTMKYLRSRTELFWDELMASTRAPSATDVGLTADNTHFKVVVPAYNSEEWIERTIQSIKDQKYNNFECIIVDDISTDSTWEIIKKHATGDKFKIIKNTEKKYALKNIYDCVNGSNPSPEDVIVVLDGDDWFSTDYVLANLNYHYHQKDTLVTYGSFVRYPDGAIGQESSAYPESVIENNSYRKDTWRASHLKTFKNSIWQMVKPEDLQDKEGNFYEISYDQAMMLPLLEMSGERAKYLEEVLCVYNLGNPNAVNKTRARKQYETMLEIRKKDSYKRLTDEDLPRER